MTTGRNLLQKAFLREYTWLAILLLLVGVGYVWEVSQPYTFRSPDEAANQQFISRYAAGQSLTFSSPLTPTEQQFFAPRSVAISDGEIRPGSFLGFVMLWGVVTKWLGSWGISAVQLLLFLAGLACWYRIVRRYWEPPWALASVLLVASHPAVVQFVTLPLFHAGLLLSGLLISGLVVLRYQEQPRWWSAVWVGVVIGVTLTIRPSEGIWILPALAVIMIARPNGWKHLFLTAGVIAVAQLPWMILSHQLFGSFLGTGYTPSGIDTGLTSTTGGSSILRLLTPAGGIWNWAWLRHVWDYAIALFPIYSLAAAVALIWYFRRKFFHWTKVLKIGLITIFGCYFLAYYGTWELYPGAWPHAFGAWNSYDRYWLPLLAASAAGIIVFFRGIVRWPFGRTWPILLLIVLVNGWTIWAHPMAGLQVRNERAVRERELKTEVLRTIPVNSILFAHGPDQIFSADRSTSFYLPSSPESWKALQTITERMPTYFLIEQRGRSIASWSAEAARVGLIFIPVLTSNGYILAHVQSS